MQFSSTLSETVAVHYVPIRRTSCSSHTWSPKRARAFSLIISAFGNYGAGISGSQLWSMFLCSYNLIQCKIRGEKNRRRYQSPVYKGDIKDFYLRLVMHFKTVTRYSSNYISDNIRWWCLLCNIVVIGSAGNARTKRATVEIHLCCCLALWLGVDVAQHGSTHPQPGVHHPSNRRLLPWDAVVVIMICEILILPPHWLFCPDRSEQQHRCLYLQDTFEDGSKIKVSRSAIMLIAITTVTLIKVPYCKYHFTNVFKQ